MKEEKELKEEGKEGKVMDGNEAKEGIKEGEGEDNSGSKAEWGKARMRLRHWPMMTTAPASTRLSRTVLMRIATQWMMTHPPALAQSRVTS